MAGTFSGMIDFGSQMYTTQTVFTSQSSSGDLYVGNMTPGLKLLWGKSFTGPTNVQTMRIAVDTSGNVVLAGSFQNSVNFGGGMLSVSGSAPDIFLAKFDNKGNYGWAYRYGDAQAQVVNAVATDSAGNIIIAGKFAGTLNLGTGANLMAGGSNTSNMFVAEFSPGGGLLWGVASENAFLSEATDVAIDPSGNVIVVGYFHGSMNLGGDTLVSAGGNDIFIAKYDGTGKFLWGRRYGDAAEQQTSNGGVRGVVALDASTILVGGTFGGLLDFGGGAMVSATGSDIFAVKLRTP
jgi:hypothetical protein